MRRVFVAVGIRDADGSGRLVFAPPLVPFVPPQFGIKLATEPWEAADASALRYDVFCREQRVFAASDRDAIDSFATTIVAVDYIMGMTHRVVGTVRIHQSEADIWYGSRLAIDAAYRGVYGLGRGLVYRAVTTAHARGARRFLANVQAQNVTFFRRMAWNTLEDIELFGHPHALMEADLAAYPPDPDDASIRVVTVRRAS